MNDRYSKLDFLHKVKERKTPSLSAQASFAPFSLKVAWSGKSLITGRGGGVLQNGRGGASAVLPLRKGGGGAEKVLAMPKGGHKKFWGSFYTVA